MTALAERLQIFVGAVFGHVVEMRYCQNNLHGASPNDMVAVITRKVLTTCVGPITTPVALRVSDMPPILCPNA